MAGPISAQTITTFDASGAGTGVFQGTYGFNIASCGTVIGFSRSADDVRPGFIRSNKGVFTLFDAPGAGRVAGQGTRAGTTIGVPGLNGVVAGFFYGSDNAVHGSR
ncbi:MAG: hypothetical protein ABIR29_10450 [Chthoniobacterales bacterium]